MSGSPANDNLKVQISNRQILKIAMPISFALLVPQANFITNNIFLSRLGQQELAAAGLTGVYYLIFAAIGFGLNNGLQALISRRAGENRVKEIGVLFSQGIRIAMFIALAGIGGRSERCYLCEFLPGSFYDDGDKGRQTADHTVFRVPDPGRCCLLPARAGEAIRICAYP